MLLLNRHFFPRSLRLNTNNNNNNFRRERATRNYRKLRPTINDCQFMDASLQHRIISSSVSLVQFKKSTPTSIIPYDKHCMILINDSVCAHEIFKHHQCNRFVFYEKHDQSIHLRAIYFYPLNVCESLIVGKSQNTKSKQFCTHERGKRGTAKPFVFSPFSPRIRKSVITPNMNIINSTKW